MIILPSPSFRTLRWVAVISLFWLFLGYCVGSVSAAPPVAESRLTPSSAVGPSIPDSHFFSWRVLSSGEWQAWQSLAARNLPGRGHPEGILKTLGLQAPAGARAIELKEEWIEENGPRRRVFLWTPSSGGIRPEDPDRASRAKAAALAAAVSTAEMFTVQGPAAPAGTPSSVAGSLFYLDRIFDLSGYTGATRPLPLRYVSLELARASDDSLVAVGATAGNGSFHLDFTSDAPADLVLRLVSRVEGLAGVQARVLDQAPPGGDLSGSQELVRDVIILNSLGPGANVDLGEMTLSDDQEGDTLPAFHLLDCLLDAVDLLGSASWLGAPPPVPVLVWSPQNTQGWTVYEDGLIRVASPGGGDNDAWSDAVVLAAVGEWFLDHYSRVDVLDGFTGLEVVSDPRRAFGDGAALVFASLVRAERARTRVDRNGNPVDAEVSTFVDLGFPPPLGFPGLAEDGLDLETRAKSFGDAAPPRGQSSVANVAAMIWDLVDDASTPDGQPGDDDPRDDDAVDGAARFFLRMTQDLPALPPAEVITYEDFHEAWRLAHGEDAALDSIAVDVGRTALFTDGFEVDDTPSQATAGAPWRQPAPTGGLPVVLGEVFLGDSDWVEITNPSTSPVALGGWKLVVRRDGFTTGSERDALLPPDFVLRPGRSVVVHEGGDSANDTFFDLFASSWSVPWQEGANGACILEDDMGAAVDFLRWDGSGGPSQEPVPPGLTFGGSLASPSFGLSLARDSLATDTDDASDFREDRPSPRAPNASFLALHSLRPAQDADHLRLASSTGEYSLVLAAAERESPRNELSLLDSLGAVLAQAVEVAGDPGSTLLAHQATSGDSLVVRLGESPGVFISTAISFGAWVPWDDTTLLAVQDLRATQRNVDPTLDTVDLSWINSGSYDSLKVQIDSNPAAVLPGSSQSTSTQLSGGHHLVQVSGKLDGFDGPPAVVGVFVGVTDCALATGFEAQDSLVVELDGFFRVDAAFSGAYALLDHANPAMAYPPADTAIALLDPLVDLTASSKLEFVHAAHLVPGDYGFVELSIDDGVHWIELARFTGSDHDGSGGGADWTDLVLDPSDWVAENLDLSAYAGVRARVRFRRVSQPTGGGGLGWILDDVVFGSPRDKVVWVSPGGDDVFGCGNQERPLATFAAAAAVSAPGDTIHLVAGNYSASTDLLLDGSLRPVVAPLPPGRSLVGDGEGLTILQVPSLGTGVYVGDVTGWAAADSGVVRGLGVHDGSRGLRVDEGVVSVGATRITGGGTAVLVMGGECTADGLLITGSGRAVRQAGGALALRHATITGLDRAVFIEAGADTTTIESSIFTRISGTAIEVAAGAPAPLVSCNDFYAFSGSPDVFLGLSDPVGQDGNVALAPAFCDPFSGEYHLSADSPLVNLSGCGRIGAYDLGCQNPAVGVPSLPGATRLLGNHPNPFNPRTRILFQTARDGFVRLEVFDARGRLVRTLIAASMSAGTHHSDWDGRDLHGRSVSTGVYHARLSADGVVLSRSLALLK